MNSTQKISNCQVPLWNKPSNLPLEISLDSPITAPLSKNQQKNLPKAPAFPDFRHRGKRIIQRKKAARKDWGVSGFKARIKLDFSPDVYASYKRCGTFWDTVLFEDKYGQRPICSCDQWFCGYCARKRASAQAESAFAFFDSFTTEKIVKGRPVYVRELCWIVVTLPEVVFPFLDNHPKEINVLTPMVDRFLKKIGVRGALKTLHFSSSKNPIKSNWHLHIVGYGKRWFSPEELEIVKKEWKKVVENYLSYLDRSTSGDFNLFPKDSGALQISAVQQELNELASGKKINLKMGYFKSKRRLPGQKGQDRSLEGNLNYQMRPFIQDLVKKIEGHNLGWTYLEKGMERLNEINRGAYRMRRIRWTGLFSSKHRADFLKSIGVEETVEEKGDKGKKIMRYRIMRIDEEKGEVLCEKQANYDFIGEVDSPYTTMDVKGRVRKNKLAPARFLLPLDIFAFGPRIAVKRYRRVNRGPPGMGSA